MNKNVYKSAIDNIQFSEDLNSKTLDYLSSHISQPKEELSSMKVKKKRLFAPLAVTVCALALIISITIFGSNPGVKLPITDKNKATKGMDTSSTASLVYGAKDLDSLIKDSPLIVVAQVTNSQIKENFQGVNFMITKLNIKSILKNNGLVGDKISLLQTVASFDPIVTKQSTVLLFLEKYEGPIPGTKDAYVCKGLYQGNYIIEGDKIIPSSNDNSKLAADIQKIQSVDALKAKVDAIQAQK